MRQIVQDNFFNYTDSHESFLDFFYKDVKGLVSIGVGFLVDPLALAYQLDYGTATVQAVHFAWQVVKSDTTLNPANGGVQYGNLTTVRASRKSIENLFWKKVNQNEIILKFIFPNWEELPASKQMALLSMSWAYGPHLDQGWPHMVAAIKAGNWTEAAAQCKPSPAEMAKQNVSFRLRVQSIAELFSYTGDPDTLPILT